MASDSRLKIARRVLAGLLALALSGPLIMGLSGAVHFGRDWRTADRSSTGLAPDPAQAKEAIVQVYAARAFNWRAAFAVHTWIATKPAGADQFTVHQVLGWRAWQDLPVVVSQTDVPDRSWYGATPRLLADLRGTPAEAALPAVLDAVRQYPYRHTYRMWPGPNSNTFVAYVGRHVPELQLNLPPTAIGKDFLDKRSFLAAAPSGRGIQLSLFGVLGVILSAREGLEINVLGLSFGLNPLSLELRLPGLGIVG